MKPFTACQRSLVFAIAVLSIVFASGPISAQTSGVGNITGTVTDSSGAAVPNATVVVLDTDTGVTRTITTNAEGSYTASFLQPGHYEVTLGGGAFGKVNRKNLVLTVGQILTVDGQRECSAVAMTKYRGIQFIGTFVIETFGNDSAHVLQTSIYIQHRSGNGIALNQL